MMPLVDDDRLIGKEAQRVSVEETDASERHGSGVGTVTSDLSNAGACAAMAVACASSIFDCSPA